MLVFSVTTRHHRCPVPAHIFIKPPQAHANTLEEKDCVLHMSVAYTSESKLIRMRIKLHFKWMIIHKKAARRGKKGKTEDNEERLRRGHTLNICRKGKG